MSDCRVISFEPPAPLGISPGAWNMAVDDALLASAADAGQTTIRFYTWPVATLSLGYFQSYRQRESHIESATCPAVRRASGGGAILHDQELTYSIALSGDHPAARKSDYLYAAAHDSLIETLAKLGIPGGSRCAMRSDATRRSDEAFLCFARRSEHDMIVGGEKIVGSAQRKRGAAVLQHGSVLLARSSFAPTLPGIREIAAQVLTPADLAAAWLPLLAERLAVSPTSGVISEEERRLAEMALVEKFANDAWLRRR